MQNYFTDTSGKIKLPDNYEWITLDLENDEILNECYNLLKDNYVEGGILRFNYSKEFLKWTLMPPEYIKEWHVGIIHDKKIKAMITGIPITILVSSKSMNVAEINFLCIDKQLRNKKLTPILIKEITRRVMCCGVVSAIYTSGINLQSHFAKTTYYHRPLNIKKLVKINYINLVKKQNIERLTKLLKVDNNILTPGWRSFRLNDSEQVTNLLNEYLSKFDISIIFNKEMVEHMFEPRDDVISSYVIEKGNKITDFASFFIYHLVF